MTDYLYTGAGSYSDIYSTALGYSTSISVSPGSFSLRFNSAGTIFYTTGIGIDELTAVDAATSAIIGSVTIGASKSGLAISNSGLIAYTSDPSAHQLSVIDLTSLTVVTTIPVGSGFGSVSGMCFDPSDTYVYAYLSDSVSSALLKIDVSSSTIAATIPMTPYAYFANGGDVVITPGGATLFVLTQDASGANFAEMTIVDVSSFTVTTTVVATFDCNYSYGIGIGNFCKSIFINDAGTTIYVFGIAGGTSGLIGVFDVASEIFTTTITTTLGIFLADMVITSDGLHAYATNLSGLGAYDLTTNVELATATATHNAAGIDLGAYTPPVTAQQVMIMC